MKKLLKTLVALVLITSQYIFAAENKVQSDSTIEVTSGKIVKTYGFADMQNSGQGIAYPKTDKIIVIDDKTYPDPIKKRKAFTNAIASGTLEGKNAHKPNENPAIIILSGTVDLSDGKVSDSDHSYWDSYDPTTHAALHKDIKYEVGANKAIIGVNKARIAFGGLTINGHKENPNLAKNIIIQNIEFWDSHGSTEYDAKAKGTFTKSGKQYPYNDKNNKAGSNNLGIGYGETRNATASIPENIWIDHCSFSDGTCNDMTRNFAHDGALDIPYGKNITVSYCDFTNHDKVSLIGSSDKLENPDERIITFHHIYYHHVTQRNPLLRASKTHIYNNLYDKIGVEGNSGYAIGFSQGVQTIIEKNYFGSLKKDAFQFTDGTTKIESPLFTKIYEAGNSKKITNAMSKTNKSGLQLEAHLVSEPPFTIPYEYTLEEANDLKESIPAKAGAHVVKTIIVNGTRYGN